MVVLGREFKLFAMLVTQAIEVQAKPADEVEINGFGAGDAGFAGKFQKAGEVVVVVPDSQPRAIFFDFQVLKKFCF